MLLWGSLRGKAAKDTVGCHPAQQVSRQGLQSAAAALLLFVLTLLSALLLPHSADRKPSRVPSPYPRPSQSHGRRDTTPESCHRGDLLGLFRCVCVCTLWEPVWGFPLWEIVVSLQLFKHAVENFEKNWKPETFQYWWKAGKLQEMLGIWRNDFFSGRNTDRASSWKDCI